MIIYCEKCRNEVHPLSTYCFYCGTAAPAKTVVGDFKENVCENPIHCSLCGVKNPEDASFCGKCSESLFSKPPGPGHYCPMCGEKNTVEATGCTCCRTLFREWYSMRGDAAEKLGFKGNLTIKEKMTGMTYCFINAHEREEISIGRAQTNDIVIPCSFVSSAHCRIDAKKRQLVDLGSGNGTYINQKPEPVHQASFFETNEFNIAGSFTFNVITSHTAFIFRLSAILDEEECTKNGDPESYEILRKCSFIVFFGDQEIMIRKQDGYIDTEKKQGHDYMSVKVENGFYYYSDAEREIEDRLLFRKTSNWPVNWERL